MTYSISTLFLIILLAGSLPAVAAKKAFIDDIVEGVKDHYEEKYTPFVLKAIDLSDSKGRISHDARRIKLVLQYKKEHHGKIKRLSEFELEQALTDNLTLTQLLPGDSSQTYFWKIEDFDLDKIRKESEDSDYYQVSFVSNEFVVDERTKVFFKLDQRDFMTDTSISADTFAVTIEDSIRFRPYKLSLEDVSFEISTAASNFIVNVSAFVQNLNGLQTSTRSVFTNFYEFGKARRSFLRLANNRKLSLDTDVKRSQFDILDKGSGVYQLTFPLNYEAMKPAQGRFLLKSGKQKVVVPIKIETKDSLGMDVVIRSNLKINVVNRGGVSSIR